MTRVVVHVGGAQPLTFEGIDAARESIGSMRERVAAELRRLHAEGRPVGLPADGRLYIRLLCLGRLLSNDEERLAALRVGGSGSASDSDGGSGREEEEEEEDVRHLHGAISSGPPRPQQPPRRRQGASATAAAAAVTADVQQAVLGYVSALARHTRSPWPHLALLCAH